MRDCLTGETLPFCWHTLLSRKCHGDRRKRVWFVIAVGGCRFAVTFQPTVSGTIWASLSMNGYLSMRWNISVRPDLPLANATMLGTFPARSAAGAAVAVSFQLWDRWGNPVPYSDTLDFNGTQLDGPTVVSAAAGEFL